MTGLVHLAADELISVPSHSSDIPEGTVELNGYLVLRYWGEIRFRSWYWGFNIYLD